MQKILIFCVLFHSYYQHDCHRTEKTMKVFLAFSMRTSKRASSYVQEKNVAIVTKRPQALNAMLEIVREIFTCLVGWKTTVYLNFAIPLHPTAMNIIIWTTKVRRCQATVLFVMKNWAFTTQSNGFHLVVAVVGFTQTACGKVHCLQAIFSNARCADTRKRNTLGWCEKEAFLCPIGMHRGS